MDAFKTRLPRCIWLLVPLLAATTAPAGNCQAGGLCWCCPGCFHIIDDTTLCEWRRTWNGPNALETPLSPYYIPRHPSCCDYSRRGGGCGNAAGGVYVMHAPGEQFVQADRGYTAELEPYVEPCRLERLGQITNDVELSVTLPAPVPASQPEQ